MSELSVNTEATWPQAVIELAHSWKNGFCGGYLRPHMLITGPTGSGKSSLAAAIGASLNLAPDEVHQTTVTKSGCFLKSFRPTVHKLLILEEFTAANMSASRLSLLKSILGGQNFPLERPDGRQTFCLGWTGLCIMISNESYQEVFGDEAVNFCWRVLHVPVDIPNTPVDVKISTKQEMFKELARMGLNHTAARHLTHNSLFDGDVEDEIIN